MRGLALALVVHGAHPLRLPSRRAFARAAAATVAAPVAARAQAPPLEQPAKPPMDPSMLDVAVQLGDLRLSRPYEVRSQMLVPTPPQTVVGRLVDAGTVWLGEDRDLTSDAQISAGIVAALALAKNAQAPSERNKGAPLAVGLEAVRAEYQPTLDDFVMGKLNPKQEATQALKGPLDWDRHWPYPIERYAPVFEVCRALGLPLVALGTNAKDLKTVEASGLAGLDPCTNQVSRRWRSTPVSLVDLRTGLDDKAWARLSLPEGPDALADRVKIGTTYASYAREVLQPDYERFVSTTAAPFFEAGDAGPNARQNFFCARLVTDASMAARAAAWVDESPRRDATIVALVGAERVAYEGGAASLCAARTGRSATRLLMNPPSATLERAVGAEGPPSYVPVATSSSLREMLPAAPPRPLADYVWFSAYRGENFI